jgi:hypothetical protein
LPDFPVYGVPAFPFQTWPYLSLSFQPSLLLSLFSLPSPRFSVFRIPAMPFKSFEVMTVLSLFPKLAFATTQCQQQPLPLYDSKEYYGTEFVYSPATKYLTYFGLYRTIC